MSTFLLCEEKILSSNVIISTKEINITKCNLKLYPTILDPSNQHLLTHLQVTQHSSNTHPYEILRYIVTSNP